MQQHNQQHNNSKLLYSLIIGILLCSYYCSAKATSDSVRFNPRIITFKGYITELTGHTIDNNYYYFYVFSEKKPKNILFSYKNKELELRDSSLIIIFWVSSYPLGLERMFPGLNYKTWLRTCPGFDKYPHKKFINLNGDAITINSEQIEFEAFNYEEYKPFERKKTDFPPINNFGIAGKTILPNMIKSNNKFFIVTKFKKK